MLCIRSAKCDAGSGFCLSAPLRVCALLLTSYRIAGHQIYTHLWSTIIWQYRERFLFPSVAVHSVSPVKVKAGSDTMIHTPQLKDSLHLN